MTEDDLDATIVAAREATDPPSDGDDVTFEAPWQARAFAITVALRRNDAFEWDRFQARLVAELEGVEAGDEGAYYGAWLRAIEGVLLTDGVLEEGELATRALAFDRGERDASEFVVGDRGHHHDGHAQHYHEHDDHGQRDHDHDVEW